MFTMDDLLEIAIKMEKNGQATYIDSAAKLDDAQLKEMLEWMADEEACHARWFTDIKDGLTLKTDEAKLKAMVPAVLQDMMGENTLSLDEIDFSAVTTVGQLFNIFIDFEKETIEFYEMLELFIEDTAVIEGLNTIIREEKKHVQTLESRLDSCSNRSFLSS